MRVFLAICLSLAACGNDSWTPAADAMPSTDATGPDAPACASQLASCPSGCVDTTRDDHNCGSCGNACSPAAACAASSCACPDTFVTATSQVLATQMVTTQAGYLSGVVGVTGSDALNHAIVVTSTTTAPLHTALAMNDRVYVLVDYDLISTTQARSTYLATAGTLTLTRRCAAGIAGTMHDVALVEVDPTTLAPVSNGCTTMIADLAFDIGQPC